MSTPTDVTEPLATVIKRRMVGLLVLLVIGFALSLLLRGNAGKQAASGNENPELKTIIVPIGGTTAAESAAQGSRQR